MIVLKSPNNYTRKENDLMVFLAGGITDCPDWQEKVIKELEKYGFNDNVIIMSPRCETFDITDKNASKNQIEWEFKYLSDMDLFSMYFCHSESVQPICMYELGRYMSEMTHKFPLDVKDRIIIGIEHGYSRTQDVIIQTQLAMKNDEGLIYNVQSPRDYAYHLALKIDYLLSTTICKTTLDQTPINFEHYIECVEQINKITELLMSGKDDSVVIMDIIKLLGLNIEYRDAFIPYGKIVDLEDGNELWSEPITDTRDGIVLRNQYGSIIASYIL